MILYENNFSFFFLMLSVNFFICKHQSDQNKSNIILYESIKKKDTTVAAAIYIWKGENRTVSMAIKEKNMEYDETLETITTV